MKLERGEMGIVALQFVALVAVVVLLSSYSPGQSAESTPTISSVYWGTPASGVGLHEGTVTTVAQNESVVTAYFTVAFSTKVSALAASRLCVGANSSSGESTTYTNIPWGYDSQRNANYLTLSPTGQPAGWRCTYTVKVTDALLQTSTWIGTVELKQ